MLLSLSWLREFVPYEGTAEALGARLTMVGLELDGLQKPFEHLNSLVVGHVVSCAKHPEADKLSVCRVDVGTEVLDIVCGAPNVAQGQKVAVAKVGCTLPNGLTIKKAALRGAPSHGMVCSEFELGLSDDHDGIMVLENTALPGARLADTLPLDKEILDIAITPNRGDCLSVLGLAREVAALFHLPCTLPDVRLHEHGASAKEAFSLDVDPTLCSLYQGRLLEKATIAKSPAWLRYRLQAVGVRSISNLVDATNYILMELGQPLHAFDADTLQGGRVVVRSAKQGESITTLDNQERLLVPGDIVIADTVNPIALGGVMGGLHTEVRPQTRRVFLECAVFTPASIRRTARRLGLQSESSYRFERGIDQCGAGYALDRAAALMAELSGATILPGIIKAEPRPFVAPCIPLRHARAECLLGISLSEEFCEQTLGSLGCTVEITPAGQSKTWQVTPPSHRLDLTREADLIEELVRIYGVDNVPPVLPSITRPLDRAGLPESEYTFRSRVKHWGKGLGLNEIIAYSFVSHKELQHLGLSQDYAGQVRLQNPLSDDLNTLRTALAPSLLLALRTNLAQGTTGVRLFEVASTYTADPNSPTTAKESPCLGILLCGDRFDAHWPQAQAELDYHDLKGIVTHCLHTFGLSQPRYVLEQGLPFLAPCIGVYADNTRLGWLGKVSPALADPFHAKKPVWMAEIDLTALYTASHAAVRRFTPLAVFPPVRRDITIIASPGVQASAILAAVDDLGLEGLEEAKLIDLFTPEHSEDRNLTFRLTFRHASRTLKDTEVDNLRDKVAQTLPKVLAVRI